MSRLRPEWEPIQARMHPQLWRGSCGLGTGKPSTAQNEFLNSHQFWNGNWRQAYSPAGVQAITWEAVLIDQLTPHKP